MARRTCAAALLLAVAGGALTACDPKVEPDASASDTVAIDTSTVVFVSAAQPESLAFVAMLGTDTVHLERAQLTPGGVIGTMREASGDTVQYALEPNGRFTVKVSGSAPSMTQTTLPTDGTRCAYVGPSLALLEQCIRWQDSLPVGVRVRLVMASADAEPDRVGSIRRTYDGNVLLELDGDTRFLAIDANGRLLAGAATTLFAKARSGIIARLGPQDYRPATDATIRALFTAASTSTTGDVNHWRMQRVPFDDVLLSIPDVQVETRDSTVDTTATTP